MIKRPTLPFPSKKGWRDPNTNGLLLEQQITREEIDEYLGVTAQPVVAEPEPVVDITSDVEEMRRFGELIGMAFQIKDDLFDYGEDKIGKPIGIDIKEQKMTLPLIYVLNNVSKKEKNWLINSIKNHNKEKKRVNEVIAFVKKNNGLDYAIKKMKSFQSEALNILETYPESKYKSSLKLMVNYVIERKK